MANKAFVESEAASRKGTVSAGTGGKTYDPSGMGTYTPNPGKVPTYDNPTGGKIDTLHAQETGEIRDMNAYKPQTYTTPTSPTQPTGYTPSSGGSSAPAASSAPAVNTAESTGTDYTQAASTVNRLVQGVDMSRQIGEANDAWRQATQNYGQQANQVVGQYEQNTNQGLNEYQGNAQAIIDQLSNLTGQQLADYANSTGQTIQQATQQINDILAGLQANLQPVNAGRVGRVGIDEQQQILQEMTNNQRQQAENQINYAVQQGVNELQRAQEDAQPQFQTQRNQIAAQERQAQDNQALYSEMRGDRGGIGQAQYNAIQNAAATNQLKVNQQQTKLATDTARQIADLRAQGEFDIADKYLEISQEYLGKLMQLKQWADEANISIDEFNIGVDQWEQEYNAKLQETLGQLGIDAAKYTTGLNLDQQQYLTNQGLAAAQQNASQNLALQGNVQQQRQALNDALAQYGLSNAQYMTNQDINRLTTTLNNYMQNAQNMASTELTGANVFGAASDATPTMAAAEADRSRQAAVAQQMISAGITPTDDQLKALGWTKSQYGAYKSAVEAAQAAAASSGRTVNLNKLWPEIQDYIDSGIKNEEIERRISNAVASGKYSDASTAQSNWAQTSKTYNGWRSLPET